MPTSKGTPSTRSAESFREGNLKAWAKRPRRVSIGEKFHGLTVIEFRLGGGKMATICRCDCGNTTNVYPRDLLTGKKLSCGCRQGKGFHPHTVPDPATSNPLIVRLFEEMNMRKISLGRMEKMSGVGKGAIQRWRDTPSNPRKIALLENIQACFGAIGMVLVPTPEDPEHYKTIKDMHRWRLENPRHYPKKIYTREPRHNATEPA